MKIKRGKLETMIEAIRLLSKSSTPTLAKLIKNKNTILAEIEITKELLKKSDDVIAYESKLTKLRDELCLKDGAGKPIISPLPDGRGEYTFGDNKAEMDEKSQELYKEYESAIGEHNKRAYEANENEVDFTFNMIKVSELPESIYDAVVAVDPTKKEYASVGVEILEILASMIED